MTDILHTFLIASAWIEIVIYVLIPMSLEFVPKGPIDKQMTSHYLN